MNSRRLMRKEFINQSIVLCIHDSDFSFTQVLKTIHSFRYWEPTYEDSLNLIARVPLVASYVYRRLVDRFLILYLSIVF